MTDDTPPTPTSAAESLWDDDKIAWFAGNASTAWEARHIADAMKKVRNDMQARIDQLAAALVVEQAQTAELQSQLDAARAGSFVPLPDGEYTMQGWGDTYTLNVCFDGAELEAWSNAAEDKYKDGSPKQVEEIGVGEYRLCRLQPASAGSEGTVTP